MVLHAEGLQRREQIRVFHKDPLSTLGMGAGSEDRPQQKGCYRVGHEIVGLDLEEKGDI